MNLTEARTVLDGVQALWPWVAKGDDEMLVWLDAIIDLSFEATVATLRSMKSDPKCPGPAGFVERVGSEQLALAEHARLDIGAGQVEGIVRGRLPQGQREAIARGGMATAKMVLAAAGVLVDPSRAHPGDYDPELTPAERRHKVHAFQATSIEGCRFCEA